MEQILINITESQGIWATLFVFMLFYTIKKNEKLNKKQKEREMNYQALLSGLTEKFLVLQDVNGKLDTLIRMQKNNDMIS